MRSRDMTTWAIAIAAVVVGAAAVPESLLRLPAIVLAAVLVVGAVAIAVISRLRDGGAYCSVSEPAPGQHVRAGSTVTISGKVGQLRRDTLWVFQNGWISGQVVWHYGGEAAVDGEGFTFDYTPTDAQIGTRLNLLIVRARMTQNGDGQLRKALRGSDGHPYVYPPTDCRVLGRVSVFVTG